MMQTLSPKARKYIPTQVLAVAKLNEEVSAIQTDLA